MSSSDPVEIPTYVMLPVPEQLIPRVMEHILFLMVKDAVTQWDEEEFVELFASCSETTKAILSLVARRAVAEKEITVDTVSEMLGVSISEVMNHIRSLNEESRDQLHPALCMPRTEHEQLSNGRKVVKRFLDMTVPIAELVQAAEAAERATMDPQPRT